MRNILLAFFFSVGLSAGQDTHQEMDMSAQEKPNQTMPNMSGSKDQTMSMQSHSLIELLQKHATAGTDAEPNSSPFEMLMTTKGSWTFMFHGVAFLNDIQQSGQRGRDKLFSTSWLMPMAQRRL
ncbi:MAG: hypothetical protein WBP52_03800, partial [Terriglobales bacterium]